MIFQALDIGAAMAGTLTRSQTGAMSTSQPPPQYNPVGLEVPFLVNNKEKWISGIVEETTCGDVVKVPVLPFSHEPTTISNIYQYKSGAE